MRVPGGHPPTLYIHVDIELSALAAASIPYISQIVMLHSICYFLFSFIKVLG